jgi:type I restriction enzyme, S subunit
MEVRKGYKQTEVGVIPKDWEVAIIGNLASFASGMGISVASLGQQSPDTPIPVYGGNGIAGYTKNSIVQEPTVVIGRVGQKCGEVYLTEGPAWITDNALFPRNIYRKLDVRFFAFALKAAGLNNVKNRNDLPLVTQTILSSVPIPIPPTLAEQEAIAEALSDADTLIESLETLLVKKRQVKQGAMSELLGGKGRVMESGEWEVNRLGDIAEIVMGQSPSSAFYNIKGEGVPLIQGNADIRERKTIKRIFTTQITKLGKRGDILMSVRAPVGEISRAMFDVCLGRGVCAIRYSNNFLYHALIAKEPKWASLSKGSTFDSVNSTDIKEFKIEMPSSEAEQTAIAEILSDMDAEIRAVEEKLSKARGVKAGMMSELLTGRIRLNHD